jgi:hypothetical protein
MGFAAELLRFRWGALALRVCGVAALMQHLLWNDFSWRPEAQDGHRSGLQVGAGSGSRLMSPMGHKRTSRRPSILICSPS